MILKKYKVIFWDFDGVLMNSNAIRDLGFEIVLKDFPKSEVDKLLNFHRINGGLSRYVKFRFFFEKIRNIKITESEVQEWANRFSEIMKKLLFDHDLLINETLSFVKQHSDDFQMFIVSGSDQRELRFLCDELLISKYFINIYGSPTPKNELVSRILNQNNIKKEQCILIGDSINDYEAAKHNKINFLSYNNPKLKYLDDIHYKF